jgi:GTP-binding protein Era
VTRSGFIALAGRPNVGKSTLVNAIVGRKVAIVSAKPQTTRRAIRGVATQPDDWQMVLCDLPGVQRPRDLLTRRMQARVEAELRECDGVLFVLDAAQGVGGPGDRFIAEALGSARVPATIVVNKIDQLKKPELVAVQLAAAEELDSTYRVDQEPAEIFPISARTGKGVQPLVDHLVAQLPDGPFFYPDSEITDQSGPVWIAELVREQVLHRTRQEVPHSVEVQVEEVDDRGDLLAVTAAIWVETESQKGILIGAQGKMIKAIGTAARHEVERELERKVYLDLHVRVRRSWRADEAALDRLGIT